MKNFEKSNPKAAVIVLNWNGINVLKQCLDSLAAQTYQDYIVLIVDNLSTDNSEKIVSEYPDMKLLQTGYNAGFAKGNNFGIEYLLEKFNNLEYIALINNDTKADENWLKCLIEFVDRNLNCGMAASKLVCWDGINTAEYIDTAGDVFYRHGMAEKRGHGLHKNLFDKNEEVFGVCAGAALYRVEMLKQIGLLDEDFFAYNEDVDWSFRARIAGWQCWFVADAEVWHRVSHSSVKYSDNSLFWAKRNSLWVIIKNLPWQLLLKYAVFILSYYIASDLLWIFRGRWKPVLKARIAAMRALPIMLKKRKEIQAKKQINYKELDRWIDGSQSLFLRCLKLFRKM